MNTAKDPIVIVGMQRSGTSSVAQALARLGVFFGSEEAFYATDQNNEAGYYEIEELIRANKDVLYSFHRPWNLVRPFPENWRDLPQAKEAIKKLTEQLDKHFSGQQLWGFKEPTTSLLLPVYKQVFEDLGLTPKVVLCVRNPLEVLVSVNRHAESYAKTLYPAHEVDPNNAGQTFVSAPLGNLALGMWLHFTLVSLRESRPQDTTVVLYEDFVQSPAGFLEQIVSGIEGWVPSGDQWDAARAGVRTDLRHNARPLSDLDKYPSILKRTYELCQSASRNPDALHRGEFQSEVESLWQEFVLTKDMLREPDPLLGSFSVSWRGPAGVKAIEKAFVPEITWQKLTIPVDAPANSFVIGAFFQQPCVAWIRSALWRVGEGTFPVALEPGPSCELTQVEGPLHRLFANSEVFQFRAPTPAVPGPYELEFDLLLEIDPQVVIDGIGLLVANLQAARERLAAADRHIRQLQAHIDKSRLT